MVLFVPDRVPVNITLYMDSCFSSIRDSYFSSILSDWNAAVFFKFHCSVYSCYGCCSCNWFCNWCRQVFSCLGSVEDILSTVLYLSFHFMKSSFLQKEKKNFPESNFVLYISFLDFVLLNFVKYLCRHQRHWSFVVKHHGLVLYVFVRCLKTN